MTIALSYILFLLTVFVGFVGYAVWLARRKRTKIPYRQTASWLMVSVIVLGSFLYLWRGAPGLPDSPRGYDAGSLSAHRAQAELPALEAEWQANPDNIRLGLRYARKLGEAGRFQKAQDIYHDLLEILAAQDAPPESLRHHIQLLLAENLTIEQGGTVTDEAYLLLQTVVSDDPKNFGARYYLAQHLAQQGNEQQAQDNLRALYEEAPEGSVWRGILAEQLGETLPDVPQDALAAADEMSDQDRNAMIRQMVDGLAEKQRANPDNLPGWKQLAHSYQVLNETDKQIHALRQGLKIAPDDETMLIELTRALRLQNQGQDNQESIEILQKIHNQNPDQTEALWFLAVHQWQNGEHTQAREKFDILQNRLPEGSIERKQLENYIETVVK